MAFNVWTLEQEWAAGPDPPSPWAPRNGHTWLSGATRHKKGGRHSGTKSGLLLTLLPLLPHLLEAGQSALACRSLYAVTEIRLHHQEPRLLTFDQRLPLAKRVRRVSGWGRQLMPGADRAVSRQHHHLVGCHQRVVAV